MLNDAQSAGERNKRRILGHVLRVSGAVLLALAAVAAMWANSLDSLSPWEKIRILYITVPFLLGTGTLLYFQGRKLLVLSAQQLLMQDARPPVVYLRSFQDDPLGAKSIAMSYSNTPVSEEEALATVMNQFGPFVAVGRPGEPLPELGAARMYVSNEEWQQKVAELMSRARLAVLRTGQTPGFWWEVARAAKNLRPEQLLFLLPFANSEQYEPFRKQAEEHLPCRLPAYPERPFFGGGKPEASVQAILYFESNWTPHVVLLRTTGASGEHSERFARAMESAVEPVARNLQVPWTKPLARKYRRSNWIAAGVVAAVIGLVVAAALNL